MGLSDATYITAGKQSQVFALASPRGKDETIYRWTGGDSWSKLNGGMASSITVGKNSALYITNSENKIFQSISFNAQMETQVDACKADKTLELCQNNEVCLEKAVVLFDKSKSELDVTQGKLQAALT